MPRSSTSIQAEINTLETFLQGTASTIQSVAADGITTVQFSRKEAAQRLDELYTQLQRLARGSMFARTRVKFVGGV